MASKTTSKKNKRPRNQRAKSRRKVSAKNVEAFGRYTAPLPKELTESPRWLGITAIGVLVISVLMIILDFFTVLPGSFSLWYILGGIIGMLIGFMLLLRVR